MVGPANLSRRRPRRVERGFSMLETIVALVILALALATLFQAYGDGLGAISAASRHADARLLAESLLAEVAEPATPRSSNGRHRGLTWQLTVKPATGDLAASVAGGPLRLYEVAATVRWAPNRQIILRSLRLGQQK
ncbi:MAG: prepilin-type N-terminal cleavage/methylation domain-containing protein [Alphaproteobacteria bacterium]|nr:prepilin-type N-terminal cleavage/methylation domain-containing protein [Alphaproteobacteria bacterium]